ncbi:hypothetical protein [Terrihabitans sp. B22-R8]|uniref:hypothetical protein n=1 Tax=Terrihabitans sp. B22-R8 TaxID=3425128 RepID=UPI00403C5BA0
MSDAFQDWEKDDQGRLKVWPLAAFTTALFANERGGLRLEIAAPVKEGDKVPALQLALERDQLRNLAEALIEVAERLDAEKPAGHA